MQLWVVLWLTLIGLAVMIALAALEVEFDARALGEQNGSWAAAFGVVLLGVVVSGVDGVALLSGGLGVLAGCAASCADTGAESIPAPTRRVVASRFERNLVIDKGPFSSGHFPAPARDI